MMRRPMLDFGMISLLTMGAALSPSLQVRTLEPGEPVKDPETERPQVGYCTCGRRISYNKSQCRACAEARTVTLG